MGITLDPMHTKEATSSVGDYEEDASFF